MWLIYLGEAILLDYSKLHTYLHADNKPKLHRLALYVSMIMYHQPWVRAAEVHAPLRGVHPQSEKGKVGSRGKEYLLNWSFVYCRDGVAEETDYDTVTGA